MRRTPGRIAVSSSLRVAAVMVMATAAHEGHGGGRLNQHTPRFLMRMMSRYEHLFMRGINLLARLDVLYRHRPTRALVDWLSGLVMKAVNGEVITLEEANRLLESLFAEGHVVAVGTCPCRRARNQISDSMPNNTDMVFGKWAEEYLVNYPGLYERVDLEKAKELVADFDRHGFVHQVYGQFSAVGSAFVVCNCDKSVCIPLQAQKQRGFQSFRKGRSLASVDPDRCVGIAECGVCIARCPFDARIEKGGKGCVDADSCFGCGVCVATCRGFATTLERKRGARLIYTRELVGD